VNFTLTFILISNTTQSLKGIILCRVPMFRPFVLIRAACRWWRWEWSNFGMI
jgi:hypothetical protein